MDPKDPKMVPQCLTHTLLQRTPCFSRAQHTWQPKKLDKVTIYSSSHLAPWVQIKRDYVSKNLGNFYANKHLEMENWELVIVSNELLTTTHKYPQILMFALVICVLSGD